MMRSTISLIVLVALATGAGASTINLQLGYVYADAAATELLETGMTGMLIADVDGSGFDAYAAAGAVGADSFLADETDVILGAFGFNGAIAGAGTHSDGLYWDNDAMGVDEGAEFALFWFNTPYAPTMDGPGADVSFGFYRTDQVVGDFAYVVPANNAGGFIQTYTANTGAGSVPDAEMAAKYMTVPEPASLLLLLCGGLAAARRRKAA